MLIDADAVFLGRRVLVNKIEHLQVSTRVADDPVQVADLKTEVVPEIVEHPLLVQLSALLRGERGRLLRVLHPLLEQIQVGLIPLGPLAVGPAVEFILLNPQRQTHL